MTFEDYNQPVPEELENVLDEVSVQDRAGLIEVWESTGGDQHVTFPDPNRLDEIWRTLDESSRRNDRAPLRNNLSGSRVSGSYLTWSLIAAAFLAGGIGLAIWFQPIHFHAPPGSRLLTTLPDGSLVELNSGSSIRYARRFSQNRQVVLEGEAYFDVVFSPETFIVQTFNSRITVLGTRFNVRAWQGRMENQTTVGLLEGRLVVSSIPVPGEPVTLVPGQRAQVFNHQLVLSTPDSANQQLDTAWRNGDLVFKNQRLGTILEDVERHFDVDILLSIPDIEKRQISLAQRKPENAETVLSDICFALNLNYRITSAGFEIF